MICIWYVINNYVWYVCTMYLICMMCIWFVNNMYVWYVYNMYIICMYDMYMICMYAHDLYIYDVQFSGWRWLTKASRITAFPPKRVVPSWCDIHNISYIHVIYIPYHICYIYMICDIHIFMLCICDMHKISPIHVIYIPYHIC